MDFYQPLTNLAHLTFNAGILLPVYSNSGLNLTRMAKQLGTMLEPFMTMQLSRFPPDVLPTERVHVVRDEQVPLPQQHVELEVEGEDGGGGGDDQGREGGAERHAQQEVVGGAAGGEEGLAGDEEERGGDTEERRHPQGHHHGAAGVEGQHLREGKS